MSLAYGSKAEMDAYAERMNAQAPQYNHRTEEVQSVVPKSPRKVRSHV